MDTINKTLAQAYLDMYETKTKRESWVPEAVADEDVADFMGAAAAAAKAGKKEFKFGDKTYKVTMKKSTVDAINDETEEACPDCGKVHEGSCMKESPEEPRAKGEKEFKKMHDDNTEIVDEKDGEDETFDNIKKSADAIKK